MEAILLVGGLGTRLHPLTLTTAKPMLPLGNIPITEHQLIRAAQVGIKRIVLSTSYLPESFVDYFHDGSKWGLELLYAVEEQPLGTAGAIRNSLPYLKGTEPIFIFNGDVISHHSLLKQLECHMHNSADVTLHLLPLDDVRSYGKVTTDERGFITQFLEKPESSTPIQGQMNAGCYLFNPEVIMSIPTGRPVSVEKEIFPNLCGEQNRMFGYLESSYWLDLGTPTRYLQANLDLLTDGHSLVGGKTSMDSSVALHNSVIGANVTIGANVAISNSLILDNAQIGENSHISHTILGFGVTVAPRSELRGVVAGDNLILSGATFPQSEEIGVIATPELATHLDEGE